MDTEGYDPSVIEGAMGTLTRNRADVVLFEYNSGGAWEAHELKNVVSWLGGVGYTWCGLGAWLYVPGPRPGYNSPPS